MKKRLLLIPLIIIAIFTFNLKVFAGPADGFILPKSIEIKNPDNQTNTPTEPDNIDIIPNKHELPNKIKLHKFIC